MLTLASRTLAYGIQLPIQAQSSYFTADWERYAGPAELAAVARAADEAGYLYVAVCDHIAIPEVFATSMSTYWQDCVATLAWLAAQTSRTALLSHIYVLPYRHPLIAAKAFATLDHLSGGRAIVGVGAGHVEAEFEVLGVSFAERGKLLDQGIVALSEALSNEFVAGLGARPRPAQSPRPPIWVGGSSPAAIRRAARLADGWLPQGPADVDMVRLLQDERERSGRADGPFAVGHITPFIHVGEPSWDVGAGTLTGSPDQIAEALRQNAPAGVNQLQVRFRARSAQECCDQVAAFGCDVGPLLR